MKLQIFIAENNSIIWGIELDTGKFDDLGLAIDLVMKEAYEDLV